MIGGLWAQLAGGCSSQHFVNECQLAREAQHGCIRHAHLKCHRDPVGERVETESNSQLFLIMQYSNFEIRILNLNLDLDLKLTLDSKILA